MSKRDLVHEQQRPINTESRLQVGERWMVLDLRLAHKEGELLSLGAPLHPAPKPRALTGGSVAAAAAAASAAAEKTPSAKLGKGSARAGDASGEEEEGEGDAGEESAGESEGGEGASVTGGESEVDVEEEGRRKRIRAWEEKVLRDRPVPELARALAQVCVWACVCVCARKHLCVCVCVCIW